jgi:hypothetical protein
MTPTWEDAWPWEILRATVQPPLMEGRPRQEYYRQQHCHGNTATVGSSLGNTHGILVFVLVAKLGLTSKTFFVADLCATAALLSETTKASVTHMETTKAKAVNNRMRDIMAEVVKFQKNSACAVVVYHISSRRRSSHRKLEIIVTT